MIRFDSSFEISFTSKPICTPRYKAAQRILLMWQVVCLLHSWRRTFFLLSAFQRNWEGNVVIHVGQCVLSTQGDSSQVPVPDGGTLLNGKLHDRGGYQIVPNKGILHPSHQGYCHHFSQGYPILPNGGTHPKLDGMPPGQDDGTHPPAPQEWLALGQVIPQVVRLL